MFSQALGLFFRPFGNIIGQFLLPIASGMLRLAANFNRVFGEQGFWAAILWLGGYIVDGIAGAGMNFLGGSDNEFGIGDAFRTALHSVGLYAIFRSGLIRTLPTVTPARILNFILPGPGIGTILSKALQNKFGIEALEKSITTLIRGGISRLVQRFVPAGVRSFASTIAKALSPSRLFTLIRSRLPSIGGGGFLRTIVSRLPSLGVSAFLRRILPSIGVKAILSKIGLGVVIRALSGRLAYLIPVVGQIIGIIDLLVFVITALIPGMEAFSPVMWTLTQIFNILVWTLERAWLTFEWLGQQIMEFGGWLVSGDWLPNIDPGAIISGLLGGAASAGGGFVEMISNVVSTLRNYIGPILEAFKLPMMLLAPFAILGIGLYEMLMGVSWTDITNFLQTIRDGITNFGASLFEGAADLWGWLSEGTASLWSWLSSGTADLWNWLSSGTADLWNWIAGSGNRLWDWVAGSGNRLWDWVAGGGNMLWDWATGTGNRMWQWAAGTGNQLWDWVAGGGNLLWDWVAGTGNNLWEWVAGTGNHLWDWVAGTGGRLWNWITSGLTSVGSMLWGWITAGFTAGASLFDWLTSGITGVGQMLWDWMTEGAVSIGNWFADNVPSVDDITSSVSDAVPSMSEIRDAIIDLVPGAQAISDTADDMSMDGENAELSPDLETGMIDVTETPGLAQAHDAGQAVGDWEYTGINLASGGIATGPTFAQIGEGRESEAVLPLSRLESMLSTPTSPDIGGGSSVEINVSRDGSTALNGDAEGVDEGSIASAVSQALSGELNNVASALNDVVQEIRNLDTDQPIEIKADGKTIAEVNQSGKDKYQRSRDITK
jgi:hypothetical protein